MNRVIIYSTFVLGIALLVSVLGRTQTDMVVPDSLDISMKHDTTEVVMYPDTLPASKANISQSAFLIKP